MIYTVTLNPSIDYISFVWTKSLVVQIARTVHDKFAGGKGINVSRSERLNIPNIATGFIWWLYSNCIIDLAEEEIDTFCPGGRRYRINVKQSSIKETEINGTGPTVESVQLKN